MLLGTGQKKLVGLEEFEDFWIIHVDVKIMTLMKRTSSAVNKFLTNCLRNQSSFYFWSFLWSIEYKQSHLIVFLISSRAKVHISQRSWSMSSESQCTRIIDRASQISHFSEWVSSWSGGILLVSSLPMNSQILLW